MPKEGEICVNCGTRIRRTTAGSNLADTHEDFDFSYRCGGPCMNPVGPSDAEPPPDQ